MGRAAAGAPQSLVTRRVRHGVPLARALDRVHGALEQLGEP